MASQPAVTEKTLRGKSEERQDLDAALARAPADMWPRQEEEEENKRSANVPSQ
jgi:hypothetical protein